MATDSDAFEAYEEIFGMLPRSWQEWVNQWPQNLRYHAIIIAAAALQRGLDPENALDVAKGDPMLLPILVSMSFHSGDESLQKELNGYRETLGPLWELAEKTPPMEFLKMMLLAVAQFMAQSEQQRHSGAGVANKLQAYIEEYKRLIELFEATHDREPIDRAIELLNDLIDMPKVKGNEEMNLIVRGELATSLLRRGSAFGNLDDLRESIRIFEDILSRVSPKKEYWAGTKNNLGNAYLDYFEHTGDIEALKKAIDSFKDALKYSKHGSPDWATMKNNLGNAYRNYFEHTGDIEALKKAIDSFNDTLKYSKHGSPDWARRKNNLGNAYARYFERTGDIEALKKAIDSFNDALKYSKHGSPDWASRKNNLGNAYRNYFEHTGDIEALKKAIDSFKDALKYSKHGSPDWATMKNNLGNAYLDIISSTQVILRL